MSANLRRFWVEMKMIILYDFLLWKEKDGNVLFESCGKMKPEIMISETRKSFQLDGNSAYLTDLSDSPWHSFTSFKCFSFYLHFPTLQYSNKFQLNSIILCHSRHSINQDRNTEKNRRSWVCLTANCESQKIHKVNFTTAILFPSN